MTKLTPKQNKFAEEYVNTGNASEAYRRAYNVGQDTKLETIATKASHLLAQYNISTRVQELKTKEAEAFQITRKQKKQKPFK
jgi:hypothetical protein